MFGNVYGFKQDYTPLLKYIDIKTVLMKIKNPKTNVTIELVHQVIFDILVTKYLYNKVFNYIDQLGETLESIAWKIRSSYQ